MNLKDSAFTSHNLYPIHPLLIVDDEEQTLKSCEIALKSSGVNNLICCSDSRNVMDIISENDIGIMILDLSMPFISGEEILNRAIAEKPDIAVIIVTGANDVETAVKCMAAGAADYMVKPVEKNRLVSSIKKCIDIKELQRENILLKQRMLSAELENPEAFAPIVTNNKKMKAIFQYIEATAKTIHPVLITGETGVGKELIAGAIHKLSGRKGEFVAINVSGLDDTIFTDSLFGHRKGSFTGANEARSGLVEKASGGTLFLDEIGDLPNSAQIKLLRLLQEREFFPIGSDIAKRMDARIIVATNQNLQTLIKSGQFRKDLYYRLLTHHIDVPALKDRIDDIPLLVDSFITEAALSLNKKTPAYPRELLTLLSAYHFPGNVRELKSMIFDAVSKHSSKLLSLDVFKDRIFGEDGKSHEHLSDDIAGTPQIIFSEKLPTIKQTLSELISEAMKRADGNQTIAANFLGITQQALSRRLKKSDSEE